MRDLENVNNSRNKQRVAYIFSLIDWTNIIHFVYFCSTNTTIYDIWETNVFHMS